MNTKKILYDAGCEMRVICGKSWQDFIKTEERGIRFCVDCKKAVFLTKTVKELRNAAQKNLCVFIDLTFFENQEKQQDFFGCVVINKKRQAEIERKALEKLKNRKSLTGHVILK